MCELHMGTIKELNELYTMLAVNHVITDRFGITPLETHRIPGLQLVNMELSEKELFRRLPPLMKGYKWLGAEIGGEPAYDEILIPRIFHYSGGRKDHEQLQKEISKVISTHRSRGGFPLYVWIGKMAGLEHRLHRWAGFIPRWAIRSACYGLSWLLFMFAVKWRKKVLSNMKQLLQTTGTLQLCHYCRSYFYQVLLTLYEIGFDSSGLLRHWEKRFEIEGECHLIEALKHKKKESY